MTSEIGVLIVLAVLAVAVMALAWRDARKSEPADDVAVEPASSVRGPERVTVVAAAVQAPAPQAEQSAIPIVPEPDEMLTAFAVASTIDAPADEPITSAQDAAPIDAIQLGPPMERSDAASAPAVAASTLAPVRRPMSPPLPLDLVRLTSFNHREPVVVPLGTHLVTASGATIRTLVEAIVPSATDAEPGSVDVAVQVVGSRPAGFESGSVVDVGQIDLVTAIVSALPPTRAPRIPGAPPPGSSPQPVWMQSVRRQGDG